MNRSFPPRDCTMHRKPPRYVHFTKHAIEQSINKFPALQAVCEKIGRFEYVRRLVACASQSHKTEHDTYIVGNVFLTSTFVDAETHQETTLAFAAAPSDREGYWEIITTLRPSEVEGNGNCRREA